MFENIIGRENVIGEIKKEVSSGQLPHALLFYGNEYGGKLSTALELARVLSCREGTAAWNCRCTSCKENRLLTYPHILFCGNRYFMQEIRAAADTFERVDRDGSRFLLIRAVRKLNRRFDSVLWEGETQKVSGVYEKIRESEELLEALNPGSASIATEERKSLTAALLKICEALVKQVPKDNIPIDLIRRASYWSRIKSYEGPKFVILENADRMVDASRNALLKILEETPIHVYFILITTRKGALIPTILSRLRPYSFKQREARIEKKVLEKIFRYGEGDLDTVKEFFIQFGNETQDPAELKALADLFFRALTESGAAGGGLPAEISEFFSGKPDKTVSRFFLEELSENSRRLLHLSDSRDRQDALLMLEHWNRCFKEISAGLDQLNMSPQLLIESLFFRMRDAV
jgi:DNA polymerase-3 subunit gamma/tau